MTETQINRRIEHFNCLVVDDDKLARNFTKTA